MGMGICIGGIMKLEQMQRVLSVRQNMRKIKVHHQNVRNLIYKFSRKRG